MTLLRANDGRATLTLPTAACKVCPKSFVKMNSMQIVCSAKCGLQYARSARVTSSLPTFFSTSASKALVIRRVTTLGAAA